MLIAKLNTATTAAVRAKADRYFKEQLKRLGPLPKPESKRKRKSSWATPRTAADISGAILPQE